MEPARLVKTKLSSTRSQPKLLCGQYSSAFAAHALESCGTHALMRAIKAADAVIHLPAKEPLCQVPVLDHGELESVALEPGVVIGVYRAPHPLDNNCADGRQGGPSAHNSGKSCTAVQPSKLCYTGICSAHLRPQIPNNTPPRPVAPSLTQVRAHAGVCHVAAHPPQVQAGAAVAAGDDVQPAG